MTSKHIQSFFILFLFFGVLIGIIATYFGNGSEKRHREALATYRKAERATNLAEREEGFNQSLSLYKQLVDEYPIQYGSGTLYYNTANNYYQLGLYPNAVLYYYKALKLDPNNSDIQNNLKATLNKLKINDPIDTGIGTRLLSPALGLTMTFRFQLLVGFVMAFFMFASFYIWKKIPKFKNLAILFAILTGLTLLSLISSYLIEENDGIILKATEVYRSPGRQYTKVTAEPIRAGTKVDIEDIVEDGRWINIELPTGVNGYVPSDNVGQI